MDNILDVPVHFFGHEPRSIKNLLNGSSTKPTVYIYTIGSWTPSPELQVKGQCFHCYRYPWNKIKEMMYGRLCHFVLLVALPGK